MPFFKERESDFSVVILSVIELVLFGKEAGLVRQSLEIVKQCHEAEVHVELLVTMEQSKAGIVSDEIDFYFLVAPDHDDILQNSSGRPPRKAREFKTVPVQMNRMDVVAPIE